MLDVAGEGRIACNQVLYHLKERAIEHAVIPWCEKHGVAVVAYSPFGHDDFPRAQQGRRQVLQRIADARRATPRQVALSFLTRDDYGVRDPEGVSPRNMPPKMPPPAKLVLSERRDRGAR